MLSVNDLRPGIKFNFRVRAKNFAGWGQPSQENITVVLKPEYGKLNQIDSL